MKAIEANKTLRTLHVYLEENTANLRFPIKCNNAYSPSNPTQRQKENAALFIQQFWHKSKLKQSWLLNPYVTYLSLTSSDNPQYLLSTIMFGKRVAELEPTSNHRINNPYILKDAAYHRWDDLSGELIDKLLDEFKIDHIDRCEYKTFIPIVFLKNTPITEICDDVRLFENKNYSLGFVALPHHPYFHLATILKLRSAGVIASPWEIATNIKYKSEISLPQLQIKLDKTLPQTSKELIESNIYNKLVIISRKPHYPTQKLAICLQKILKNLPKNIKPQAIQLIACIVDITNIFYKYDYPTFALSIYTTIHELSLSLLEQTDQAELDQYFNAFFTESKQTLDKALSIHTQTMDKSTFIACPALSGTNAYFLALKLALKMQTTSGKPPVVKIIKPTYFESDCNFNKSPQNLFANIFESADIYILSAGPIVNPEGLTPGTDLNKFIMNIADVVRKKAVTLIVDTTTALYKNLHLCSDAQKFISEGKLSIIINESHQKFGLIHTDQAQYGRMFAICSNEHFANNIICEMQELAKIDFSMHLDLQVGAYISSTCGDTLETIKEQHFKNGALLRKILIQTSWASPHIVTHEHMLSNFDELYFITSHKTAPTSVIETRDSFGHFNTVLGSVANVKRVSPDASDSVDCLIQAAQISLAQFSPKEALNILMLFNKENLFSISEQIIAAALANKVLNSLKIIEPSNFMPLLFSLKNLVTQCHILKGRQSHNHMIKCHFELHQKIIVIYGIKKANDFFSVSQRLNNNAINITSLYFSSSQIQLMIDNKVFCDTIEKIHITMYKFLYDIKQDLHPHQYQNTKKHSELYFIACFNALEVFYKKCSPGSGDKKKLITDLNQAKEDLYKNITNVSNTATSSTTINYLLKWVENCTPILRFDVAPYPHYTITNSHSFFTKTNKLEYLHHQLVEEINNNDSKLPRTSMRNCPN